MDALKTAFKWPVVLMLLPFGATTTAPVRNCRADDVACCCSCGDSHHHFDGSTLCRWSRTWHGPNSLRQPLDPYFIPRRTDPCDFGGYARCCGDHGCQMAIERDYVMEHPVAYEDGNAFADGGLSDAGLQPGLERLGQIPNDLGIAGAMPAGPARPGR